MVDKYRGVEIIVLVINPTENTMTVVDEPPNKIVTLKRMKLFPAKMPLEEIIEKIGAKIQELEDDL